MSKVTMPEPWAIIDNTGDVHFDPENWTGSGVYSAGQLEAYKDACVRESLRQAAAAVEQHGRTGREWVLGSLWDTLSREASARIRALINTDTKEGS